MRLQRQDPVCFMIASNLEIPRYHLVGAYAMSESLVTEKHRADTNLSRTSSQIVGVDIGVKLQENNGMEFHVLPERRPTPPSLSQPV